VRIANYGLSVLLTLSFAGMGCESAETPPPPIPSAFEFLDGKSPAAQAMTSLYKNGRASPATQAEADAWAEERTAAKEALQANLAEVQAALLQALRSLAIEETSGFLALAGLLDEAGGSTEILDHLQRLALSPLSPAELVRGEEPSPEELTRVFVTGMLYRHAKRGNSEAKVRLLTAARSPAFVVQKDAVQYSLHLSRNRRLTQRALAAELPAECRFLLYQF
jgi:hypothetical protein